MDQNIDIRVAEPADAQALLDIYAPYVTSTAITFEYAVPSEPQFTERIRHTLRRYPFLVAERQGTLLGYAYAGPFKERPAYDWAAETTIYVRQDCRPAGHWTKAVSGSGIRPQRPGHTQPQCLYRLSRARGRIPDQRQRLIPSADVFSAGRNLSQLRLQISPLVSHGVDGEADRHSQTKPARCTALFCPSRRMLPQRVTSVTSLQRHSEFPPAVPGTPPLRIKPPGSFPGPAPVILLPSKRAAIQSLVFFCSGTAVSCSNWLCRPEISPSYSRL